MRTTSPGCLPLRVRALARGGSVLIIVLWIAFGLVAITLYFAHSMSLELRASDNRFSGMAADQAIEGVARYICYVLANQETNGFMPDLTTYRYEEEPLGDSTFWLIGRGDRETSPKEPIFGLVDEASKLNLNNATADMLALLPRMTPEIAAAIVDWRDSDETPSVNGAESQTYALLRPPYLCKNANFDTVDELRLVYGTTMEILLGEDLNRNGVLDANEVDEDHNGLPDPGILEYVTVYTREPNTRSDGTPRINVTQVAQRQALTTLLTGLFGAQRATAIVAAVPPTVRSTLEFYDRSGMTAAEFGQIANDITATNATYLVGLVNVNTASEQVLACIPGIGTDKAPLLVSARMASADNLNSVAWVKDVLGRNGCRTAGPFLTTRSYQFSADVAAVGPHGRGYKRTRFVIDTSDGTPTILYRQDLSHLGWALGREVRQMQLAAQEPRR